MDKKTRKANKVIEESKNFLKSREVKRKKESQPLIPPPPSPKTMNYWICEGESIKSMAGIIEHHLDCKTIQGKRSILLKRSMCPYSQGSYSHFLLLCYNSIRW